MAAQKVYQIQINGLTESVNAVNALNDSLKQLEGRINALQGKVVNVGAKASAASALSEEEKIQKQIEAIEEKRLTNAKEIYREYLKSKDALKEVEKNQKSIASAERLDTKTYANTIAGMKQELADIKSAMQNVDLGDTDVFEKMTQRANELNGALKKIEESYGQFGRNVGNYKSAFDGLQKISLNIGGTVREFNSAREASKTLGNELKTMAVNGQTGTKAFNDLRQVVMELESSMNDAKKPMDDLMDAMQSVVAIANVGQGIRGLFGIDDTEIQKSIKNLVALQGVLKGIETINNQIQTREGIGKWIAPFNTQIEKATAKLLVYNRALLGTGKAAKVAAVGIKAFSKALKMAFTGGILIVVDLLVEKLMDLVDSFKKVDEEAERTKEAQKDMANAYGEAQGKLIKYKATVDNFNGTKKEEKKLVEDLNKEFGDTLGTYKSLAEWQDVLKKKGDAYIQTLVNQAKAQAALNEVTAAYMNLESVKQKASSGEYSHWYQSRQQDVEAAARAIDEANQRIVKAEENLKKTIEENNAYDKENGLGDYSPQIDKNAKKTEDAAKKAEESISKARIDAMKNGFAKTLAQLELERNKRIEEARKTGYKVAEQIKMAQKIYNQQVFEATVAHHEKLIEEQNKFNDEWEKINKNAYNRNVETSTLTNAYNLNKKKNDYIKKPVDVFGNELNANEWVNEYTYNYNNIIKYNQKLIESYKRVKSEVDLAKTAIDEINNGDKNIGSLQDWQDKLYENEQKLKDFLEKYPDIDKAAEDAVTTDLLQAYATRTLARQAYYDNILKYIKEYADKEIRIEKDKLDVEQYNLEQAEKKRHELMVSSIFNEDRSNEAVGARLKQLYGDYEKIYNSGELGGKSDKDIANYFSKYREELNKWLDDLKNKAEKGEVAWEEYIEITNSKLIKSYIDLRADAGDNLDMLNEGFVKFFDNLRHEFDAHTNEMQSIEKNYNQKIKDAEEQRNKDLRTANAEYFSSMESEVEEVLSSINSLMETSQQRDSLGLINMKATKKNLDNLKSTTEAALRDIEQMKADMLEKLKEGEMEFPDFDPIYEQLRTLELQLLDASRSIKKKTSEIFTEFMSEISNYMSQLGSELNNLVGAIGDYTDQQYENEINQLQKFIDEYEELLDKQEEVVSKHKSKIDSIEDELATARGARRQHLIDQINAEIEAERKAVAEQKRLEKEKAAIEKQKEDQEIERLNAQKRIQQTQAIINGAVAFMNALSTQPIWLGMALAALTASMTAVQLATISSAKYAQGGQLDGGVAQGPRHRDGGIPVLGGRANIEGGEFITNRLTTSKNIDLLEFINSKKKKVDVSDLIEFYQGGSIKRSISSVRTKFEDGGYVPTLPNSIDVFDNKLLQSFENYSNRPIYVTVTDIENRMEQVKYVRTLAGVGQN